MARPCEVAGQPAGGQGWLRRLLALDRKLSSHCSGALERRGGVYRLSACLAHSGDGLLVGLLGVILWLVAPRLRHGLYPAALGMLLCACLVAGLKFLLRRERPAGLISARWSAAPQHDLYSFPSGHAARLTCIAFSLSQAWPGMLPWLLLWTLAVGLARVAVGAHYLLDVLAGWLLGLGVAAVLAVLWPG